MKIFFSLILLLSVNTCFATTSENKELEALIQNIEIIRKHHSIASTGLIIIKNGELIYSDGLGTLSHNSTKRFDNNSVFRIGSITKSFTALGILKLAEAGQLDLNTSIHTLLPETWLKNAWQPRYPVRVSHLLEHTAGLPDLSWAEFDTQNIELLSLEDTLTKYHHQHKTHWPPAHYHSYTNLGSAYLGYILEKISGQVFEKYMQQHIFQPLNMFDSSFLLNANQKSRFVLGYDVDGITRIPYWYMTYRPFGAMNTTLSDLNNFLFMLLKRGKHQNSIFIHERWLERLETPQTTLATQKYPDFNFGYGAGNYAWFTNGVRFHGHGGDADGYLSRYGYSHTVDSAYFHIISAFNKEAHWKINRLVENFLTRDLGIPKNASIQNIVIDTKIGKRFAGEYRPLTARFKSKPKKNVNIVFEDQRLYTVMNNRKRELIAVDRYLFRRKTDSQATSAFIVNGEQTIYESSDGSFSKINSL